MIADVVKLIIAGAPHTGTTLCLQVFRSSRDLESGIEIGILNTPGGLKKYLDHFPYSTRLLKSWGLEQDVLNSIINESSTYEDFYRGLRTHARIVVNRKNGLIDKTPAYINCLELVVSEAKNVPIIIMRKDPKNFVISYLKRGFSLEWSINYYRRCYMGVNEQLMKNHSRIKVIQFEEFVANPVQFIKEVCEMMKLKYYEKDYQKILKQFKTIEIDSYKKKVKGLTAYKTRGKTFKLSEKDIETINNRLGKQVMI